MSSLPVYVALPEAFWHFRVEALELVIEYDEPEPEVGMVTVPAQAELPVPSMTCSCVESTFALAASTRTVSREGSPARVPTTVVSQARCEPRRCRTTRRVAPSYRPCWTRPSATLRAVFFATVGRTDARLTALLCATLVVSRRPAESVTTTKSPPTTWRPR
jgi:hypothetical protein